MPGEGILIWHIDDKEGLNNPRTNPPHPPYWVYLEQADGREDLDKGKAADDEDPYSSTGANDQFNDNTIPNSIGLTQNTTLTTTFGVHHLFKTPYVGGTFSFCVSPIVVVIMPETQPG